MTTKERFNAIIAKKLKKGEKFIYLVIGLVLFLNLLGLAVSSPDEKEAIPLFYSIIMILVSCAFSGAAVALFMKFRNIQLLKNTIVCPECKKNLSYLVTDPNYTNKYFALELPEEFPCDVTNCPFCKFDLNSEGQND